MCRIVNMTCMLTCCSHNFADHYRGRIGEPWGLADYAGYQGRRRHEERVLRERERSREREDDRGRRSLSGGYRGSRYGDEEDEYDME